MNFYFGTKMKIWIFVGYISCTLCEVIVQTKLGAVKGTWMQSRDGKRFNAFMAVPYAKPPIGELRFREPQTVEPWNGIFDATKYPPMCPQSDGRVGYKGQEDCLYLNIYTPQNIANRTLPVWVFIYGGRRIAGHVAPYKHGPHYIMDKPVIFITMTYRIGPLGFLSTEDNVISGNYGLKDEVMVLQWIQDHIASFGGDPTNVTISGGSTGAIDVGLHLISPMSTGLFHRAISQSGHPMNTVLKQGFARRQAWELAKVVGCGNTARSEELLICLRRVPVNQLIQQWASRKHDYLLMNMAFGPVIEHKNVDTRFLIGNPYLEINKSNHIPWLLGMNSDEGTVGATGLFVSEKVLQHFSQHHRRLLPIQLRYDDSPLKDKITNLIMKKYFKGKPLEESFQGFSKAFSLAHFISGTIESAIRYRGPKYFYIYDHENNPSYVRNYFLRGLLCKHKTGVTHGEELRSLQHYPMLLPPIIDGEDRIVSDKLISMWYNFVATSNPNNPHHEGWKPITTTNIEYLHISNHTVVMKNRPFWNDFIFWKNLQNPSISRP